MGAAWDGENLDNRQQIARVLKDSGERILVISTTNKATDAVAFSLGEAAKEYCPDLLNDKTLQRIGKGSSFQAFAKRGLEPMLAGTESDSLSQVDTLAHRYEAFDSSEDKALTRKQITELQASIHDRSNQIFMDFDKRAVISTAFKAMSMLKREGIRRMVESGEAPFTTIFIDEAGLISRAAVAVLSLLAARRVVLVGDS
ncbi:MAG: hypothetical protein AAF394_08000 [Planctomycetota bacterium]